MCTTTVVSCPNDCSGHGKCVSIGDMARMVNAQDSKGRQVEYGSGAGLATVAWDHNTMYGCVCDSDWIVRYHAGQRQLSTYFGPDCSLSKLQ